MKAEKTKYLIGAVLAVAVIGGLVLLGRERVSPGPAPVVSADPELSGGPKSSGTAQGPLEVEKDPAAAGTAASDRKTTDNLYGLPPLTMENVDINPEKPADMPLADWEEYERQRYEMVQLKAYKFRQTDPSKVKPYEIAEVVPEAAKKYDIPQELLAALLYTSSDGGHHYAEHDIEGGFGLMMLKESPQCDTLGEAAQLLGVSREDVIYDQRLNVLGGAAVLRQYYDDAIAAGLDESEAWYMAVSQYSGRPQPILAAALADQVAGNMMKGFEIDSEDGSGYYVQDPNPNPIFLPKNWKLAAVDPPAGTAEDKVNAGAAPAEDPGAAPGGDASPAPEAAPAQ